MDRASPITGERANTSAHLRVLAEVSHAFATVVTDYHRLVETIVRSAADLVGDGCQIFLVSDDGRMLINAGNAHRDPAVESDVRNALTGPPQLLATSQMVSAGVVRSGEPKLIAEIDPDAAVARTDDAVKPLVARVRIHSAVIVPIRARDAAIGALSLIRTRPGHSYTSEDLTLLQDIADRAGLAIENARLYDDLERRVRERTAELEAVNKELESFSYSVSHDLRAPLRAIDGFTEAFIEEYGDGLDDQGGRYLDRVRSAAHRMGQLIDDLLTLARIARAPIQREQVDVSALARRILSELRVRDPDRTVETSIAEGLVAEADARLLAVLFDNLLGNAWKFTAKRPRACIEVGEESGDGARTFFVRDNGAGFDMAYAARLFAPFQRLHAESDFPGTGIGLATVLRVLSRHGGRIWAEGAKDRGATFHFTLGGN
jgi:signal transduction histidine kinase